MKKVLCSFGGAFAAFLLVLAETAANIPCYGSYYQPKAPTRLKKE